MFAINTERLVLRSPEAADVAPLFALFNDWAVVEWLSAPPWPYRGPTPWRTWTALSQG